MKKPFFFIALSLVAFLAMFSFAPKFVLADGMMIRPDPHADRWDYSGESNQQAFINYDKGLQKMIISVGLEGKHSKGLVWLFPVPADPNKVAIDVVKSLPELSGEEISGKAKSNLDDTTEFLQLTQLYTIPFVSLYGTLGAISKGMEDALGAPQGLGKGTESDVVVYEHLDKEGISSEIITAKTANGLYDYLKGKGLKVETGSIPVLDNYIGKDYSFIASWISSPEKIISAEDVKDNLYIYFSNQYRYPKFFDLINTLKQKYPEFGQASSLVGYLKSQQGGTVLQKLTQAIQNNPSIIVDTYNRNQTNLTNQRGIFVTFPTEEIYFPLLPTSVYGSKTVPATIRIVGHVSPKVFQGIKSYTKTEYYFYSYASFADDLKNFYSGQNQNIKYTKVEINAPSKFLTDDLWFVNQAPIKTYYSTFVAKHPIVSAIILFILSSILAGILAGLIVFKDLRKKPIKLGLIGLSNFLTIIGLIITTVLVNTKNKNESTEPILTEIKQKGYLWKRRVATILFFVAIPFLVFGLFALPSLVRKLSYLMKYFDFEDFIPVIIICVLPIAALIVSFIIKRIKPEDKNLFEQLKLSGYSSWSFQPKDKLKIAYIPIFSISFLVISWLLVKFIELTV